MYVTTLDYCRAWTTLIWRHGECSNLCRKFWFILCLFVLCFPCTSNVSGYVEAHFRFCPTLWHVLCFCIRPQDHQETQETVCGTISLTCVGVGALGHPSLGPHQYATTMQTESCKQLFVFLRTLSTYFTIQDCCTSRQLLLQDVLHASDVPGCLLCVWESQLSLTFSFTFPSFRFRFCLRAMIISFCRLVKLSWHASQSSGFRFLCVRSRIGWGCLPSEQ